MRLPPAVFANALLGALLICTSVARGDLPAAQVHRINAAIDAFAGNNHVATAGVGIAQRGRLLYSRNASAVFEIGSLTKQFTAALVLMFVAEGKIDLQAPLARYVPGYAKAAAVTVRQLLDQTSGIPDYADDPHFAQWMQVPQAPSQLVDRVRTLDLRFAPGTRFDYSNTNYVLLGMILERVSGEPYETLLAQRISLPYRLSSTRYAAGALSAAYSAGGLISSVNDVIAWQDALASGRVLPPQLTQLMFAPGAYGFGLMHDRMYGRELIGHSGSIPGFSAYAGLDPKSGLQIVLLAVASADLLPLAKSIVGIVAPPIDGGEDPEITALIAAAVPAMDGLRAYGTPLSFDYLSSARAPTPSVTYRISFERATVTATFGLHDRTVTLLHLDEAR